MALTQFKATVPLLILSLIISSATSARILDETAAVAAAPTVVPTTTTPGVTTAATTTSGEVAAASPTVVPTTTTPGVTAAATTTSGEVAAAAPTVVPTTTTPGVTGAATTTSGGAATATTGPINPGPDDHSLTFFMHDILGGSRPSAIAVTGIVANPAAGGQVPFAKPNGAVLPVNNGIPTNNANGGIVNNNNIPFLTGLSGFTSNFGQNNNNFNNNNNIIGGVPGFPVLNTGQFPSGTTLQKLMFGTMTVFDDELTEGHELGSGLVGKAQGFYVSSSEDGTSQMMAFTVMFKSGSYADSLSFLGVHRTAVAESHLAIMGGTGKYVNAKGFALVKTFPGGNQHETDGVETLLQFTVYLAY